MNILKKLSFGAFPGCCLLCHARTERQIDICTACQIDLPTIDHACPYCALPIHPHRFLCQQCTLSPPPYSAALCGFEYRFPVDHLIQSFKASHNLAAGYLLTQLMLEQIAEELPLLTGDEIVLPVPLHWRTLRKRGFNQSGFIAQWIGATLGLKTADSIKKIHDTTPQKSLSLKDRRNNLRGVFRVQKQLNRQRIILIDDVITTGATSATLSQLLMKAGAEDVIVLALARTPSAPDRGV